MSRRALSTALAALLVLLPAGPGRADYGDMRFTRAGNVMPDYPPAVFPHWIHRMQYRCYVCHTSLFEMKSGANPVTMEAIQNGQYCGACHNGKTAFSVVFESCPRCHVL